MKIILLVITGNFLSGSFRFVGAPESICFCSLWLGCSISRYLKTPEQVQASSLSSMAASHTSSGWQKQFPFCPDVDFLSSQGISEVLRLLPSEGSSSSPGSWRMSVQGNGSGMRRKAKDYNVLLHFPLKIVIFILNVLWQHHGFCQLAKWRISHGGLFCFLLGKLAER